ncbi:helix-turn-helix transcriptional regulator [Nocardia beijingensis]|uniref:winged helix-turn-helix transcriptional regulator n=1 Tax=Nocardia beijingensis TaxID=95162 RepID=UPI0018934361|nr:helix-turn-helix domain-containing protein [Nocardia beijingensis]MBF6463632.1 helix-turn-helix transcriptional regulator [Nocardia beijingensis]
MDTACAPPVADGLVDNYLHHCPAREVLTVLADKWVMLVLAVLRDHDRPIRFNELRRRLDGITQKMLTRTLRDLEREGMVRRAVYPTVPPRVEYSLTEMGASIGAITHAMGVWAVENQDRIVAARVAFDARAAAAPQPLPTELAH